jgi:hypothetical protein
MAAEIVLFLSRHHRETARALFLQLVDGVDDRLLATRYVRDFLYYRGTADFEELRPVVERMVDSQQAKVRNTGAIQASLIALDRSDAAQLATRCKASDDETHRLGAAQVCAANLTTARYRSSCEEALKQFFDDPSAEVRKTAGNAIWRLQKGELAEFAALAQVFLESQAFVGNEDDLLHALSETTARLPELVLAVCDRILTQHAADKTNSRLGYQAGEAMGIVLRAYADASDRAQKERALDLIDRSLKLNVYGTTKVLVDHDRPWATVF